MAEKRPIQDLMGVTMEKMREMVDVQTIIGDPIVVSDKVTIVPVSKVSYGFASGGSDLPVKTNPKDLFGGGAGAGAGEDAQGLGQGKRQLRGACAGGRGRRRGGSLRPRTDENDALFRHSRLGLHPRRARGGEDPGRGQRRYF